MVRTESGGYAVTLYTHRIAFLAPTEQAEACNLAANALGRTGLNFAVRLSASGQEPATHIGGSAVETDAFMAAVSAAPALPEGMDWPGGLDAQDWDAVAQHLQIVSSPASNTSASDQFSAMLESMGLQVIRQSEV